MLRARNDLLLDPWTSSQYHAVIFPTTAKLTKTPTDLSAGW
jgi:hypothetical protein